MANSIKGLDGGSIGPDTSNPIERIRGGTPVGTPTAGTPSSTSADLSVHITSSAHVLASLSQAVNNTPDIDESRVAAVQQAIASGQYKINPERIANRLVQLDQDLGNASQQ